MPVIPDTTTMKAGTDRLLCDIDHGHRGPTFLVQGGIHGNEPAGVQALQRIVAAIQQRGIQIFGRLLACRGNLTALAKGRRYVTRDLNRQWLKPTVEQLLARDCSSDGAEDQEQRVLLGLYERCFHERRGPVAFVDLHTSSAAGAPFTCLADTIPNRRIADAIPVPMILGLEECIEGAAIEWFNERGQIALAIEGGQHQAAETIDNLESAVWLAMVACGVIDGSCIDVPLHRQRLQLAARNAPHLVEIRYRHCIRPDQHFVMRPGYASFQPVARHEILGDSATGPVRAPEAGLVLLPLYQGQGEDGFFIGRRIARFWFELSAMVRRLPVAGLLALLPGVRRDAADRNTLQVDPRLARFLVVQIFHLCGFRQLRTRDDRLRFSRRVAAAECYRIRPR